MLMISLQPSAFFPLTPPDNVYVTSWISFRYHHIKVLLGTRSSNNKLQRGSYYHKDSHKIVVATVMVSLSLPQPTVENKGFLGTQGRWKGGGQK